VTGVETGRSPDVMRLTGAPRPRRTLLREVWSHRDVIVVLARSDFQVRYKRAALGVIWAVAVPLLQAAVLAVVFSRVIKIASDQSYGLYVLSGVMAWGYFSTTVSTAGTAIVDGSDLTDKVWFPRAVLPIVPVLSGLVGLAVSLVAIVVAAPVFGVGLALRTLVLVPGALLLVLFTGGLSLVLAGMHVYFRDVRFLVQAGLLMLFYATPVLYPLSLVGSLRPILIANPMTGVVEVFHYAATGSLSGSWTSVLVPVAWTLVLLVVALELYRRHDRLFVDQL
jgi:lipopolysaccharide transport system permease protein